MANANAKPMCSVMGDQRKEKWIEDNRDGKFPIELDKPYIDKEVSFS